MFKKRLRNHDLPSTQDWLDVKEIKNGLVVLAGGDRALILEVSPLNFELRTDIEKEAILAAYAEFLNSVNFPVQIVCRSELLRLDVYLDALAERAGGTGGETGGLMLEYRTFLDHLIKSSNVLTRRYYVVLPCYAGKGAGENRPEAEALRQLENRRSVVESGLTRLGLTVRRLDDREIADLLKKCYNLTNLPFAVEPGFYMTERVKGGKLRVEAGFPQK